MAKLITEIQSLLSLFIKFDLSNLFSLSFYSEKKINIFFLLEHVPYESLIFFLSNSSCDFFVYIFIYQLWYIFVWKFTFKIRRMFYTERHTLQCDISYYMKFILWTIRKLYKNLISKLPYVFWSTNQRYFLVKLSKVVFSALQNSK